MMALNNQQQPPRDIDVIDSATWQVHATPVQTRYVDDDDDLNARDGAITI